MITYIIKSGALLTVFYLFFILFMRKTTFFRFNRITLMAGTAVCMILPLVDISALQTTMGGYLPHIVLPEAMVGGNVKENSARVDWKLMALAIYFAGAMAVLVTTAISLIRTKAELRTGEKRMYGTACLTIVDGPEISFSFFNHIVMSREDFENNPVILSHEIMHVQCHHSLDNLLFSVITVLQWFNPVVWLTRIELKQIHEYEADEAVLKKGIDATLYQLLLVKKAVGAERFQMANGFNHTKLKKRIKMMQSTKTNRMARLAYIACLPLLLSVLCFCTGQSRNNASNKETVPYQMLGEKPEFRAEGFDSFSKWVAEELNYPESAKEAGIQGRVMATFTIDKEGNLTDLTIDSGLSEDIDNEVLRVLSSSPKWTPGKRAGKVVNCSVRMPVIFELK